MRSLTTVGRIVWCSSVLLACGSIRDESHEHPQPPAQWNTAPPPDAADRCMGGITNTVPVWCLTSGDAAGSATCTSDGQFTVEDFASALQFTARPNHLALHLHGMQLAGVIHVRFRPWGADPEAPWPYLRISIPRDDAAGEIWMNPAAPGDTYEVTIAQPASGTLLLEELVCDRTPVCPAQPTLVHGPLTATSDASLSETWRSSSDGRGVYHFTPDAEHPRPPHALMYVDAVPVALRIMPAQGELTAMLWYQSAAGTDIRLAQPERIVTESVLMRPYREGVPRDATRIVLWISPSNPDVRPTSFRMERVDCANSW